MYVYTCEPNITAMFTCIYEAWSSGHGQENIKLLVEPIEQLELFNEYIHVEADEIKARKVADAVNLKISPAVFGELIKTTMSCEKDALDNIYRVMILGFHFGPSVLNMVQYRDVIKNREIRTRAESEGYRFQEILRFHNVDNVYVAHFEPRHRVLGYLGPVFQNRMPSEHFIIVDDVHREAAVHRADEDYYIWQLDDFEFERLLQTEEENDEYTDMWKVFFDTIAIEERNNRRCQMNHFPLWARKHAVEFS